MNMQTATSADEDRGARRERRQFNWMIGLCFLVFFVIALLARLTGWRWRPWPPGAAGYGSVVDEALREANTVVPFVFMA